MKWRPPSLSELSPIIFHIELTHLGLKVYKYNNKYTAKYNLKIVINFMHYLISASFMRILIYSNVYNKYHKYYFIKIFHRYFIIKSEIINIFNFQFPCVVSPFIENSLLDKI